MRRIPDSSQVADGRHRQSDSYEPGRDWIRVADSRNPRRNEGQCQGASKRTLQGYALASPMGLERLGASQISLQPLPLVDQSTNRLMDHVQVDEEGRENSRDHAQPDCGAGKADERPE